MQVLPPGGARARIAVPTKPPGGHRAAATTAPPGQNRALNRAVGTSTRNSPSLRAKSATQALSHRYATGGCDAAAPPTTTAVTAALNTCPHKLVFPEERSTSTMPGACLI